VSVTSSHIIILMFHIFHEILILIYSEAVKLSNYLILNMINFEARGFLMEVIIHNYYLHSWNCLYAFNIHSLFLILIYKLFFFFNFKIKNI